MEGGLPSTASIPRASEIARERRRRASLVLDGFPSAQRALMLVPDTQPSHVRNEKAADPPCWLSTLSARRAAVAAAIDGASACSLSG